MTRPYPLIAIAALALLGFGVVMVASAGISIVPATAEAPVIEGAGHRLTVESIFTGRPALYAGLALAAMTLAAVLPVRHLARLVGLGERHATKPVSGRVTLVMLGFGAAALIVPLLLVYTPLGHEANFARRWLAIGSYTFQPSELAKWGSLVLIAWYAARRAMQHNAENPGQAAAPLNTFFGDLLPVSLALGAIVLVVMKEDLGTAALIAAAGGVVLFAAGMRWLHILLTVPPVLAALVAGVLLEPYRYRRITAFLRPFEDAADSGYHMIQSMAAVAGGEVTGRGLGHGLRKFGYLPEDTTDFVFAIICEELGVFGPVLVLTLYGVLLGAIASVAWRERHLAMQLFCIGVLATIGLQATINIAVVVGLAPTKGIALPLISHGGTGWILTAACLGLVIAIARTQPEQTAADSAEDESHAAGLVPA